MNFSIVDTKKRSRGRPTTGIGPNVGLRLHPDLSASLDAWIAKQPAPRPSKPAAIRQLIEKALAAEAVPD